MESFPSSIKYEMKQPQESATLTVSNYSEEISLMTEFQRKVCALHCRVSSVELNLGPVLISLYKKTHFRGLRWICVPIKGFLETILSAGLGWWWLGLGGQESWHFHLSHTLETLPVDFSALPPASYALGPLDGAAQICFSLPIIDLDKIKDILQFQPFALTSVAYIPVERKGVQFSWKKLLSGF